MNCNGARAAGGERATTSNLFAVWVVVGGGRLVELNSISCFFRARARELSPRLQRRRDSSLERLCNGNYRRGGSDLAVIASFKCGFSAAAEKRDCGEGNVKLVVFRVECWGLIITLINLSVIHGKKVSIKNYYFLY